jgi:hypothetical protein
MTDNITEMPADTTPPAPVPGNDPTATGGHPGNSFEGWNEIKRELEKDAEGNFVVKKLTIEKNADTYFGLKKDSFDFVLRGIGILTILIPVMLFFAQQDNEADRRWAITRSDIYANITSRLHTILDKEYTDTGMAKHVSIVQSEYYPRFRLFATETEARMLSRILKNLEYFNSYVEIRDSLLSFAMNLRSTRVILFKAGNDHVPVITLSSAVEGLFQFKPYLDITRRNLFGQLEHPPADTAGFAVAREFGNRELVIIDSMHNYHLPIRDALLKYMGKEEAVKKAVQADYYYDYSFLSPVESAHYDVERAQGILLNEYRHMLLKEVNQLDSMMVASFKKLYGSK